MTTPASPALPAHVSVGDIVELRTHLAGVVDATVTRVDTVNGKQIVTIQFADPIFGGNVTRIFNRDDTARADGTWRPKAPVSAA